MEQPNLEQLSRAAQDHHRAGDLSAAKAIYQRILAEQPNNADAICLLGLIARQEGKADQAIELIQRSIVINPAKPEAHYHLGDALRASGKPDEAAVSYSKAIELRPTWAEAHAALGDLLADQQKIDSAIASLTKALQLKPALFTANWKLAEIFISQNRQQEATDCYQRAAQLNPNNAQAHFYLACQFAKAGKHEEAAAEFREAIRLKPDSPGWKYQLAAVSGDRSIKTTPAQYIRELFDFYAPRFDTHLVDNLKYQIPKLLKQHVLSATQHTDMEILDLGSGTGLCGLEFRESARRLVGVDLSPEMNKIAAARSVYDELITGDLLIALRAPGAAYDLILAAEVLMYVGDISELFPAVAAALKPGGIFAYSIEHYDGSGFFLNPNERFAHSITYVREIAASCQLNEISAHKVILRHDGNGAEVFGWIVLVEKKLSN